MHTAFKKSLAIAFTALLYTAAVWGLILLVLALKQSLGVGVLILLAGLSLIPVLLAEHLWSKRLGIHWLVVRLVCPPLGGFLFLVTVTILNPMLWMNGILFLAFAFFALCQGGFLLLSILCTVVYRKMKKSRSSQPQVETHKE